MSNGCVRLSQLSKRVLTVSQLSGSTCTAASSRRPLIIRQVSQLASCCSSVLLSSARSRSHQTCTRLPGVSSSQPPSPLVSVTVCLQFSAQPLPSDDVNPVQEAKNQTAPDHRQEKSFHVPDFSNFEEAHKPKSNLELVRAYGVFTTCQIRPVVKYADTLLGFTKKVLGANITYNLVRATFFGHFCAGTELSFADLSLLLTSLLLMILQLVLQHLAHHATAGPS